MHGFYNIKQFLIWDKGSFPLIAKPNSQARCENFHLSQITIFEKHLLAASLRVSFCDEWKRLTIAFKNKIS